jgi:hypothetical protein
MGEVLLKDKFLTQSAPDIHKKTPKVCGLRRKIFGLTSAACHLGVLQPGPN